MDLSLLNTLKKKLSEATVFKDVWEYFLDNFGEKLEFHKFGEKCLPDPVLVQAINEICKMMKFGSMRPDRTILVQIPEYGFVHGSTVIDYHLSSILYFPAIHKGMLTVCISNGSKPETKFIRFTSHAYYDGLHRSVN